MPDKVYGYPVWPLEDQPPGNTRLSWSERIANAKFIAWNLYQNGLTYEAACGAIAAIVNESSLDPCLRESHGPGLGWIQNSYPDLPAIFEYFGYKMPRDWLNLNANCYAQVAQIIQRLATNWSGWYKPPQREFNEETQAWDIVGHPSVDPTYELSHSAFKSSTDPVACAGAMAVMMEHPYGVNKVYGYYGDPVGTAEDLNTALQGYLRYANTVSSWFTEESLQYYDPPIISYPSPFTPTFNSKVTMYALRPWWQRLGR